MQETEIRIGLVDRDCRYFAWVMQTSKCLLALLTPRFGSYSSAIRNRGSLGTSRSFSEITLDFILISAWAQTADAHTNRVRDGRI